MNDIRYPRKVSLLLIIILGLYGLLATGYALATPLFEAPDEHLHFFAIDHIADTGSLPTIESGGALARQEAAQPPLYYLLAAPLVSMVDTTGAEEQLWHNPTVINGEARPINVNNFIHTEREAWPWQGYALAAHLVRSLSTIIGLGTLLSIFGSGRLIWPQTPSVALLATALVAFLPQFAFLHGVITNDVLIIFFSSFAIWQLLWLWLNEITTTRLLLLGATIGLAILSKMAGLLLLVLAFLVLGMMAWRNRRDKKPSVNKDTSGGLAGTVWWRELLWSWVLVAVPALLISGWLLWRNWTLYGDPTAVNQFVSMAGKNRHFTLRQVWNDMDRVLLSAVAYFGWMNLLPPRWLHLVWAALLCLAGGGWLFAAWCWRFGPGASTKGADNLLERNWSVAIWMGVWALLVFGAWLRFMIQTPADQGRLLFPILLPVSLFVARGVINWRMSWLPWLAAIAALITSAYSLLVVIPNIYNAASLVAEEGIPESAFRLNLDMGQGIEIVAVEPRTEVVRPGEWAWVDLYWRAAETLQHAPLERLGLYGRENALVGRQLYYHGGGTFPANQWPAGQIVKDRVGVQLFDDAILPAQLRLLMRIDENRDPVEIARVKAVPRRWPQAGDSLLATFGNGIDLTATSITPVSMSPGSELVVDVQWKINNAPGSEYTTFVHLGDPAQAPLAQGDGPALGGDYPSGLWAAGEVIDDRYVLTLPEDLAPGSYPVHIGFYDPQSGARLPVEVGGEPQPHHAYLIGTVTVTEN